MKAGRIHKFGGPDVIVFDDLERPAPGPCEVVVRVAAAGVGPWDALIREGKSKVSPPPPLTLGSDLSGVVEAIGRDVGDYRPGDEVYGVTNPQFCGAYAEYAVAAARMIAPKPRRLSHVECASVPVVAVTAWQMLFEYAHLEPGQRVLILGAAGNVGAYAVQLAAREGLHIAATAGSGDIDYVRRLGADVVFDRAEQFEAGLDPVDAVIDTVGGEARSRSLRALKSGAILVSVVSTDTLPERAQVRSVFFYVEVTTARLSIISGLFDRGELTTRVGTVLALKEARVAHEMLAGSPHKHGKIVLDLAA
jgi:NADPH:quinone reductase-like Zn-dependent oxidoreductase